MKGTFRSSFPVAEAENTTTCFYDRKKRFSLPLTTPRMPAERFLRAKSSSHPVAEGSSSNLCEFWRREGPGGPSAGPPRAARPSPAQPRPRNEVSSAREKLRSRTFSAGDHPRGFTTSAALIRASRPGICCRGEGDARPPPRLPEPIVAPSTDGSPPTIHSPSSFLFPLFHFLLPFSGGCGRDLLLILHLFSSSYFPSPRLPSSFSSALSLFLGHFLLSSPFHVSPPLFLSLPVSFIVCSLLRVHPAYIFFTHIFLTLNSPL